VTILILFGFIAERIAPRQQHSEWLEPAVAASPLFIDRDPTCEVADR
jgi:hypothetical protein